MTKCYIIGISGVTNSGKTSLTNFLHDSLHQKYKVFILHQDDYIRLNDPKLCPKCGQRFMGTKLCSDDAHMDQFSTYHDWETLTVFDMDNMWKDIGQILECLKENSTDEKENEHQIFIIEGFMIFDDERITSICDMKVFLTLDARECKQRRSKRKYDPGDPKGYFEKCVWPGFQKYLTKIRNSSLDINYLEGNKDPHYINNYILEKVSVGLKVSK